MLTWKTPQLKNLSKALATLDNEKDIANFLRDLCTLEELTEISHRWEAVQMINNKKTYREIAAKTGMSTATVTRIARWLKHGEGGYKKTLEKLAK
ncbi:MAG: YerC/YecD family TrpR-related protein [Candidatus Magasanikiibacteriota bacterium]